MIPISHRNGEVSEKLFLEAEAMGFGDSEKGGWEPVAVSRRKYWAGSAQLKANGFILTSRRAKKLIPDNRDWRVIVSPENRLARFRQV